MTKCNQIPLQFSSVKKRKVQVEFDGKEITSDAGVILLAEADKKIDLLSKLALRIPDNRRPASCDHSILGMLRQRVYGVALGYEDLNDHDYLRKDKAFQTAVGQDEPLASSATLCRFENTANREVAVAANKLMVESFIQSHSEAPEELILDFDATDDRVFGDQEGKHYHGYYQEYCFMPLYVFCGDQLLVSYLRPSNIDGARHSWAILSLLVKEFRKCWPKTRIIFRGDSGFCRDQMIRWCEKNEVFYIVAMGNNRVLKKFAIKNEKKTAKRFYLTKETTRCFGYFMYRAKSWKSKRKVIVKTERNENNSRSRFLISNLPWDPEILYTEVYCPRGDMENGIKQMQLDLFSDRTSCNDWWANQLRVIISSMAYILIDSIRRLGLKNTKLANATVGTIRLKLLKIGAVVTRNTRKVLLSFSSYFPYQEIFKKASLVLTG